MPGKRFALIMTARARCEHNLRAASAHGIPINGAGNKIQIETTASRARAFAERIYVVTCVSVRWILTNLFVDRSNDPKCDEASSDALSAIANGMFF